MLRMQDAVCRYSTSPNPPHFNHTSYELSTEDKFEIMEVCHRYGAQAAADSTRAIEFIEFFIVRSSSDSAAVAQQQGAHACSSCCHGAGVLPEDSMLLDASSAAEVCWLI